VTTATVPVHRGTTNSNVRGNNRDRQRRREWLVETYRANVDLIALTGLNGQPAAGTVRVDVGMGEPACRCYRCGVLLTVDTVTVDRIVPGCQGGTYRRNNIRPACGLCNSETGATTRSKPSRKAITA